MIYIVDIQNSKYPQITLDQVKAFIDNNPVLGFDLETTGFFPQTSQVTAIGLGTTQHQIIMPGKYLTEIGACLYNTKLIGQNLFFDLRFTIHHGLWLTNYVDTMIAEKVIRQGHKSGFGLDALILKYLNITIDKKLQQEIAFTDINKTEFIEYLAQDVKYLNTIHEKQNQELLDKKLKKVFYFIENKFVSCLAYSAYHGFQADKPYLIDLIAKRQNKLAEVVKKLDEQILLTNSEQFITYNSSTLFEQESKVVDINWNSPIQVIAFFDSIGINVTSKNKKTKEFKSTSSYKEIEKFDHPAAKLYGEYSKLEKQISSFGLNILKLLEQFSDDRIRTSYNQIVESGRISSGGKTFDKIKLTNLQNIPRTKEDRAVYISKPDYSLIILDYSQQEPRLISEFSKDPKYSEYTLNPELDIHCMFAQFRYPELRNLSHPEIIKKHSDKRSECKSLTFAFAYLGTAYTAHQNSGIPLAECEELETKYKQTFPLLYSYYDKCFKETETLGYILINDITNRRRYLPEMSFYLNLKQKLNPTFMVQYSESKKQNGPFYLTNKALVSKFFRLKSEIQRVSVNTKIQGTAADMTKIAENLILSEIVSKGLLHKVLIPNRVHDEIVLECPDSMIEDIKSLAENCMMKAAELFLKHIPMHIGITIAKKWLK